MVKRVVAFYILPTNDDTAYAYRQDAYAHCICKSLGMAHLQYLIRKGLRLFVFKFGGSL